MAYRVPPSEQAIMQSGGDHVGRMVSVAERKIIYLARVADIVMDAENLTITGIIFEDANEFYDIDDIQVGMTIELGTENLSHDVGISRIRLEPDEDESLLFIAAAAPAEIDISIGDFITIREEYRPSQRQARLIPVYTGDNISNYIAYHDYDEAYDEQNRYIKPKANIVAGERADQSWIPVRPSGWTDQGQVYRELNLSALASKCFTYGHLLSTVNWDIGDGTAVSGDPAEDWELVVRFPVGFRYITLTVYDTAGALPGIVRMPIWVHDEDNYPPIIDFSVGSDNTTTAFRTVPITVWGEDLQYDEGVVPKQSLMCYWEEPEFTTGTPNLSTGYYRDQMLGWITNEIPSLKITDTRVTFTISGLAYWLDRIDSQAQTLTDLGIVPTNWHETTHMTINSVLHYIATEYSTMSEICNIFYAPSSYEGVVISIPKASVWSQLSQLSKWNQYSTIGVDTFGQVHVVPKFTHKLAYQRTASAVPRLIKLTGSDWTFSRGLELSQDPLLRVGAVSAAGNTPDFDFSGPPEPVRYSSRAPGRYVISHGTGTETFPYQWLNPAYPQTVLNWMSAHHWKYVNNPRANISLELLGNLDVFEPCLGLPLEIEYTENTVRGTKLNRDLFLVKSVNTRHSSDGLKKVVLSLEGVTEASQPGQTMPVEQMPGVTVPEEGEIPEPVEPPQIPEYTGDLVPTELIVFNPTGPGCHVAFWIDAVTGIPLWEDVDSAGLTGYTVWAGADPYNYGRYFTLQSTGLYRNDAPFEGGTWSLVSDNDEMFGSPTRIGHDFQMSINRRAYMIIPCGENVVVSFDYGATWSASCVNTDGNVAGRWDGEPFGSVNNAKIAVSPYNNPGASGQGWVYAGHRESSYSVSFSDDWGLTWVRNGNPDCGASPPPHIPYIRVDGVTPNINDDDQEVYVQGTGNVNGAILWLLTNKGATKTQLFSIAHANNPAPAWAIAGRPMSTFTWDGRKYATAYNYSGVGGGGGLMYFDDDVNRVVIYGTLGSGSGINSGMWTNRFSNHSEAILWGARSIPWIYATLDNGVTYVEIPLPSGYTGCAYSEWTLRHLIEPS